MQRGAESEAEARAERARQPRDGLAKGRRIMLATGEALRLRDDDVDDDVALVADIADSYSYSVRSAGPPGGSRT